MYYCFILAHTAGLNGTQSRPKSMEAWSTMRSTGSVGSAASRGSRRDRGADYGSTGGGSLPVSEENHDDDDPQPNRPASPDVDLDSVVSKDTLSKPLPKSGSTAPNKSAVLAPQKNRKYLIFFNILLLLCRVVIFSI